MVKKTKTSGSVVGRTLWDLLGDVLDRKFWKTFVYFLALVVVSIPVLLVYKEVLPSLAIFTPPQSPDPWQQTVYVPASRLWLDTGIVTHADEPIELTVSGAVHLAVHHLTWAAIADIDPEQGWYFYPTLPGEVIPPEKLDAWRKVDGALAEDALGTLLLHVAPSGVTGPTPADPNVSKDELRAIRPGDEASAEFSFRAPRNGRIFFVVNDVVPTADIYASEKGRSYAERFSTLKRIEDSFGRGTPFRPHNREEVRRLAEFLGLYTGSLPEKADAVRDLDRARWDNMAPSFRNRLWFEDNAGGYLVTVRFPSRKR